MKILDISNFIIIFHFVTKNEVAIVYYHLILKIYESKLIASKEINVIANNIAQISNLRLNLSQFSHGAEPAGLFKYNLRYSLFFFPARVSTFPPLMLATSSILALLLQLHGASRMLSYALSS